MGLDHIRSSLSRFWIDAWGIWWHFSRLIIGILLQDLSKLSPRFSLNLFRLGICTIGMYSICFLVHTEWLVSHNLSHPRRLCDGYIALLQWLPGTASIRLTKTSSISILLRKATNHNQLIYSYLESTYMPDANADDFSWNNWLWSVLLTIHRIWLLWFTTL